MEPTSRFTTAAVSATLLWCLVRCPSTDCVCATRYKLKVTVKKKLNAGELDLRHLALAKEFRAQEEAPGAAWEGRTGLMSSTVCRALSSPPSEAGCVLLLQKAPPPVWHPKH